VGTANINQRVSSGAAAPSYYAAKDTFDVRDVVANTLAMDEERNKEGF
jgi:hypothetical protein